MIGAARVTATMVKFILYVDTGTMLTSLVYVQVTVACQSPALMLSAVYIVIFT